MLTPTDTWLQAVGSGRETFTFWTAFFNPTYLPSLVIRTLICVSWAGVFALITAARIDGVKLPDLKLEMIAYARRWLLPAFILLPICFAWFVTQMPEASQALLTRGLATSAQGAFTIITRLGLVLVLSSAVVVVVTWLFTSADNARDFSLGNALSIAAVAFMVMASTEMVREMLRKPYVVSGYMYSNGTRPVDTERLNTAGYLTRSPWDTPGETGLRMFQGQCLSCHTRDGYRSLRRLLAGRDRQGIESLIKILRENKPDSPYRAYMPPVVGTDDEVKALVDYLASEFPPKGK
jgi:cytochrome c553